MLYTFFDHEKSSSVSQLLNRKWRDLQKLLKCFNETTVFASNVLLSGALPITFVLSSKDLVVIYLLLFVLLSLSLISLASFASSASFTSSL